MVADRLAAAVDLFAPLNLGGDGLLGILGAFAMSYSFGRVALIDLWIILRAVSPILRPGCRLPAT